MNEFRVKICGGDQPELVKALEARLFARISNSELNNDEIVYVSKLDFLPVKEGIELSPELQEKIRTLCRLWDVDFKPLNFSSHRPLIGPVIIFVKKLFYPIIKLFMKDIMEQQKLFNASCISALIEVSSSEEKKKPSA